MRVERAKRLKAGTKENARLKELVLSAGRTTPACREQNGTTPLIPVGPHRQAVTTNIKR